MSNDGLIWVINRTGEALIHAENRIAELQAQIAQLQQEKEGAEDASTG